MSTFFLTLDLEDWYHLDYLKGLKLDKSRSLVPRAADLLGLLDDLKIKMTVFVLGEVANQNPGLVREIASRGHEIACHGLDHRLLYEKSNEQFREEMVKVRSQLEDLIGERVLGYRAPCYSMTDEKLNLLPECGYRYDSSFIRFRDHPLYGDIRLTGFTQVDDLIYRSEEGFTEFEVPTVRVLGKDLPISGGGYFRVMPWTVFEVLFRRYRNTHRHFLMYIHPFELTDEAVELPPELSPINRFRFNVGRRSNLTKIQTLLSYALESGFEFRTLGEFAIRDEG